MLQPFLFRYEVSVGDAGNLISSRTSAFQVNLLAQKPKLPRVGEVSWPLENFGHLKMAWRRLQHQLVSLSFTEVDTKWPNIFLSQTILQQKWTEQQRQQFVQLKLAMNEFCGVSGLNN